MNTTTATRQTLWHIDLGDEVLDRPTGRIGRVTQKTRDGVVIRFDNGEKAVDLNRARIIPLAVIQALAEVDEDEANAAAYREATR
jgi:hypothetical protein